MSRALDVVHETFIGQCNRCGSVVIGHNTKTNSFAVSLERCNLLESDASLRARVPADQSLPFSRGRCYGHVIRVENHDAVVTAYRLGGEEAVIDMLPQHHE